MAATKTPYLLSGVRDLDEILHYFVEQNKRERVREEQGLREEYEKRKALLHAHCENPTSKCGGKSQDQREADIKWLEDELQRREKALAEKYAANDQHALEWIRRAQRVRDSRLASKGEEVNDVADGPGEVKESQDAVLPLDSNTAGTPFTTSWVLRSASQEAGHTGEEKMAMETMVEAAGTSSGSSRAGRKQKGKRKPLNAPPSMLPRRRRRGCSSAATGLAQPEDPSCSRHTAGSAAEQAVPQNEWGVAEIRATGWESVGRQYWHLVDETQVQKMRDPESRRISALGHRVPEATVPVTWTDKPFHFHLGLRDLTKAEYAPDSQIVVIGTEQAKGAKWTGSVLALFTEEQTKWRFVVFMEDNGVDTVQTTKETIENKWNQMHSEIYEN